jgi:hypothetical protein
MRTGLQPKLHQHRTCAEGQAHCLQHVANTTCSPRRQRCGCPTLTPFWWGAGRPSISSCAGGWDKRRQLTATSVAFPYGKVTPPKYTSSPCFDAGIVTITPSARPMVSGPLLFVQKLLIMSYLRRPLVAHDGPDQPGVVRLVE